MSDRKKEAMREAVRETYARVARRETPGGCCGPEGDLVSEDDRTQGTACGPVGDRTLEADRAPGAACGPEGCCTEMPSTAPQEATRAIGYTEEELRTAPREANLGLGCGNPLALAALEPGQTVLDLGSGGGFDVFLAAKRVGPGGKVIGVDMTPEMIAKARQTAERHDYVNVEFRLGETEHLPVADGSVDAVISNCVINLSPDKPAVYREAFRVLRPRGRLAISDIVALSPIPAQVRADLRLHVACVSGAETVPELERILGACGFEEIRVQVRRGQTESCCGVGPERGAAVAPALITAVKPRGG